MDSPALSFHLFKFNRTHPSRPKRTFTTFQEALPDNSSPLFIYPALPYFNPSSENSAHSHLYFLTDHLCLNTVQPGFTFHTLFQVLQGHVTALGANPMAFSQCSSSLQCLTLQTTSWHLSSLVPQNTTFSRFSYFSDNSFFLPFLPLLLNGGVFHALFSALPFLIQMELLSLHL